MEGKRITSLAKTKPKQFWKNIKKTYKTATPMADKLNLSDLFEHFKSLYETTDNNINNTNNIGQTWCKIFNYNIHPLVCAILYS